MPIWPLPYDGVTSPAPLVLPIRLGTVAPQSTPYTKPVSQRQVASNQSRKTPDACGELGEWNVVRIYQEATEE